MAVFTNSPEFGGEFLKKFETLLNNSSGATIAVGYTSAESIERISARAKKIVDHGGIFRLLVGLAFFEGFLECHEKYKPLVDDLEDVDCVAANKALQYYYKEILGEK